MILKITGILMMTFWALVFSAIPTADTVTNSIGMKFKRIPAGTFQMGFEGGTLSNAAYYESKGMYNEYPRHTVVLTKDFYMGRYEVTCQQFSQFRPAGSGATPVVGVSWHAADSFCQWLTANDLNGWQYRLPTEAEWEYCCRAGTSTRFSTGDTILGNQANFGSIVPVGTYPPNSWSLYDMHGNAEEWCLDWPAPYAAGPDTNPGGLSIPSHFGVKAERGINNGFFWGRSAVRGSCPPVNMADGAIGFRVVISNLTKDSLRYRDVPDTLQDWLKRVASALPVPKTIVTGETCTDPEGNVFKRVRMSRTSYPTQRDSVIYVSLVPLTGDSGANRNLAGAYARRLSRTYGVLVRLSNRYELFNASLATSDGEFHLTILPDLPYSVGRPHPDSLYYVWRQTAKVAENDSVGGPLWYNVNHAPALAECPNGDMLATWFSDKGEDTPEQNIAGSRLRFGEDAWDARTSLVCDFAAFPDDMMTFWNNGKGRLFRQKSSRRNAWVTFTGWSDDNGLTWSPYTQAWTNGLRSHCIVPLGGDTVVCIPEGNAFKLMMSTDGGYQWSARPASSSAKGGHHVLMALDNGTLFGMSTRSSVNNSDGIATMHSAVSTDKGLTWTPTATPFRPGGIGYYGAALKLHSGRLIAVTPGIGGMVVVESEDQGKTWFCRRKFGGIEGVDYMSGYMHLMQGRDGVIHLIGSKGSGTGNGNQEVISFTEQWLLNGTCLEIAEWGINTAGMAATCPGEAPKDSTIRFLSNNKPVTSSSSVEAYGWGRKYLTDGITHSGNADAHGYSSTCNTLKTDTEWVEIDLGQDIAFNRVVLFPRTDVIASFPEDFKIEARTAAGDLIEMYSITGCPNPDSVPVSIRFTRTTARFVRLTATRLGIPIGGCYYFQLSEMQVLDSAGATVEAERGGENGFSPLPSLKFFPSPFNPSCRIRFSLPATGSAKLDVYSMDGKQVKTLVSGTFMAGSHETNWDATDAVGKKVAAGVYAYRLTAGNRVLIVKSILAK